MHGAVHMLQQGHAPYTRDVKMFEWAKVNIGFGEKQLGPSAELREKALQSHYFSILRMKSFS